MAEVYSSLFKGNVHITQGFKPSHQALDFGNYKTRNPIYSPNALGNGRVSTIYTSYNKGSVNYPNTLVVWITYDNGYKTAMYHGEVRDKIVNVGDRVTPGMQVYRTGNTGYSFGDHLHFELWRGGVKVDPTNFVVNDKDMKSFKVGDRIKFSGLMNIRSGAGTGFKDTGDIVKGAVGQIIDGPRTSQNEQFGHGANDKYTWYDFKFTDLTGWVADTGKMSITTDPVTPLNGVKPLTEVEILKEEIEELKIETRALGTQIETLEKQNEELLEANEDLNKYKEYFDKLSVLIETKI